MDMFYLEPSVYPLHSIVDRYRIVITTANHIAEQKAGRAKVSDLGGLSVGRLTGDLLGSVGSKGPTWDLQTLLRAVDLRTAR